jgi:hypothetical protein
VILVVSTSECDSPHDRDVDIPVAELDGCAPSG